jgi:uncharacterized protein
MTDIVVFGAGGRAGRAVVAEARRRGHPVTAAVRTPAHHAHLEAPGTRVVAADATDPERVAAVAAGADAAVHAAVDLTVDPGTFFPAAARALAAGLARAAVPRLVVVGLASVLPTADGRLLMDTDGYPQDYRALYLGHAAGVVALRDADADWLVVSPAGDFDRGGGRSGSYIVAPADADSRISYADLAVAVLDEIEAPTRSRTHIGVETPTGGG